MKCDTRKHGTSDISDYADSNLDVHVLHTKGKINCRAMCNMSIVILLCLQVGPICKVRPNALLILSKMRYISCIWVGQFSKI